MPRVKPNNDINETVSGSGTTNDNNVFNHYNKVIFICESGPLFQISMDVDSKFKGRKEGWANQRSLPVEFDGLYFCHIAKTKEEDDNNEDEPANEGDEQFEETDGDGG